MKYEVKVVDSLGLTTWFGPYPSERAAQVAQNFRDWGMRATVQPAVVA